MIFFVLYQFSCNIRMPILKYYQTCFTYSEIVGSFFISFLCLAICKWRMFDSLRKTYQFFSQEAITQIEESWNNIWFKVIVFYWCFCLLIIICKVPDMFDALIHSSSIFFVHFSIWFFLYYHDGAFDKYCIYDIATSRLRLSGVS